MIIRLTPPQIAKNWEVIKYSIIKGDLVEDDHRMVVLNETLRSLLSEKAQCFIRIEKESRHILAVMITRIRISNRSQEKFLYIQCLYSYRPVTMTDWQNDWKYIIQFAKNEDCKYILTDSGNPRVFKLLDNIKAKEISRTFRYSL